MQDGDGAFTNFKMNKGKFILVDGTFVPTEEYRISLFESESFHFSEKIRAIRSALPFFRETLELIKLKLLISNHSFPEFTDNNGAGLKRQLERTLTKNKHFMGAVLHLTFRLTNQKVHFTILSEKLDTIGFELNEKGLYVGTFDKIQKSVSSLSTLSLGSEMYWNIARNHLKNANLDQLFLVNTDDQIVEIPGSNVYLIKGRSVRGASSEQGAYIDITRPLILDIFSELGFEYTESEGITISAIQESDEILLANAIEGIQWIIGYEGKRFFNNTIRKINEVFNLRITN